MNSVPPPSFLDRLLPAARGWGGASHRDLFLEHLARDVEDLLSSSSPGSSLPLRGTACGESILDYGLPDRAFFASDERELSRLIATTITRFEPRLVGVRVKVVGPDPNRVGRTHLEIIARLAYDPREPIRFEVGIGPDRADLAITSSPAGRDER